MRLLIAFLLASPYALAGELKGVTMPDTKSIDGKTLVLNGMGIRKKFLVANVYVAGLYLEKKESDPKKILSDHDSIKHIDMEFLMSVSQKKIKDAWVDAFRNNMSADQVGKIKPALSQLKTQMKKMSKGHIMSYTISPGKVVVSYNGKPEEPILNETLAKYFFLAFFGPKPPNEDLPQGLLGK